MRSSFGVGGLLFFDERLLVREALVLFAFDELDAVIDQVRREVFDLLFGELDFLESFDDVVVGEKALLFPRLDKLLQFFDVGESNVDSEHLTTTSGSTRLTRLTNNHQRSRFT